MEYSQTNDEEHLRDVQFGVLILILMEYSQTKKNYETEYLDYAS